MVSDGTQVGIALGIAALCASAAVVTAVREPGPLWPTWRLTDGERTSRSCAGARAELTVTVAAPVHGTLTIVDPRERTWRLDWSTHDALTSLEARPPVNTVLATFPDPDQGTWVRLRPEGAPAWCWLSVSLDDH